jgi:hypothetical protein
MISASPRRRRRIGPSIVQLESRRLLSFSVTSDRQDGHDFVGPDASQGDDGIVDLHLVLSGLSTTVLVNYISVSSFGIQNVQSENGVTPPFQWATGLNPNGYAYAEYFQSSTYSPSADLYINPQIRELAAPAGTGTPVSLGGSTGLLGQLQNGDWLDVTLHYQDGTSATAEHQVGNLISATDPMPATGIPTPVVMNAAFTVTDDGQPSLSQDPYSIVDGWEELTVVSNPSSPSNPSPIVFTNTAFGPAYPGQTEFLFSLSDDVGIQWFNNTESQYHDYIYEQYVSSSTVNLWFQPIRVESPVNGSTAPTMTLQIQNGTSTSFVSQFEASTSTNLSSVGAAAPTGTGNASTEAELDQFLGNTDPVGTVDLTSSTIYVNQPLQITHSVTINGNGDTIWFDQSDEYHSGGNTGVWPTTDDGAIFVSGPASKHIVVTLNDFTIEFDPNVPIQWSNGAGGLWDPENAGIAYAVINTGGSNSNQNTTTFNLERMTVDGPPAFDSSTYSNLQTLGASENVLYVGEPDIDLIATDGGSGGVTDNGTISGSTFQGGPVELWGGPWTVTNNYVDGAVNDTYSTGAFSIHSPHDLLLQGNHITQLATAGYLFRLVVFSTGGSDNTIEGNWFSGGNVGFMGQQETYEDAASPPTFAAGAGFGPEIVLQEPIYTVYFEGVPSAISTDGRELVLPNVRSVVGTYSSSGSPTGYGLIVSILSGANSNGSPNMSSAGEWFQVAQQVSYTNGNLELLMQDPLPAMPGGGDYMVELTPGYVNSSYIGNTIDTIRTASTDINLNGGLDFGTRIIGNELEGGSLVLSNTAGDAIVVNATTGPNTANGTIPAGWTVLPALGTVIEDNVILDAMGGIQLGGEHGFSFYNGADDGTTTITTTGRVFLTATVVGNEFEWDQSYLTTWENTYYAADGNILPEQGEPSQSELLPTLTVGTGWSPYAPGDQRPSRFPSTVGNSYTDQGVYDPYFVDPTENVVDAQGNYSVVLNSNGTVAPQAEPTGQVYDGIVNGTVFDGQISVYTNNNPLNTYNNAVYFPLNVNTGLPGNPDSGNQLNINDAPTTTQGIQALMIGQDNYDLVGAGSGSPVADGVQDLHLELTGLSTTDPIGTLTVTDNSDGEQWIYDGASSPHQIVVNLGTGSTTADIFIQPTAAHLDDNFTIQLSYSTGGGPIAIPVQGVSFNPYLPVLPTVPQAPLALSVTSVTTSQVSLSWSTVPGAATYSVEEALASSPTSWTPIATPIATSYYTYTGLSNGMSYLFQVAAINSLGGYSAYSLAAKATTSAPPSDSLTVSGWIASKPEGATYNGTVATFVDTNHTTPASSFTASIGWGDGVSSAGTVTGGSGVFTVSGSHVYSAYGNFDVLVNIAMVAPGTATGSTVSTFTSEIPFTEVSLSSYYTQIGITVDSSSTAGNLDGANDSYSYNALGDTGLVTWNTAVFQLGNPGSNDVVVATGQTITLPSGSYTGIEILGTAVGGVNQGGVFTVNYSGSAYDKDTLGMSDWLAGYNGAGTTAPGEATVLDMSYNNTYTGGAEVKTNTGTGTYLYGYVIPTNPAETLTSLVLPNDSDMKILAIDLISQPSQVKLSSYYNTVGITTAGSTVAGQLGVSKSYSSSALGSTVTWGSNTFSLGPANAADAMAAEGQSVWLAPGSYASIAILGVSASGYNQALQFWVVYSDGSYDTITLALSDWSRGYDGAGTNAPGETTVATTSFNQYSGGSESLGSGSVYLYGYTIPVNPNKTVTRLQFGNNNAVDILAIDLIQHPEQVNLGYGNSGGVALPYNEIGITSTNSRNQGGIDSAGDTYSAAAAPAGLGESVTWNAQTFVFGPGGTNNVVQASGQSITLAPGNYTSLQILGAATSGYEQTAVFYVYYVGGSYDTFTQAFSDWKTGYLDTSTETLAPGESIVEPLTSYNKLASGPFSATVYLYGYVFPLNPAKTVAYIKLPTDTSIKILAMDEVDQPGEVDLAAGSTSSGIIPVADNIGGIGTTLTYAEGNLDGHNDAYSSAAQPAGLGSSIAWNG